MSSSSGARAPATKPHHKSPPASTGGAPSISVSATSSSSPTSGARLLRGGGASSSSSAALDATLLSSTLNASGNFTTPPRGASSRHFDGAASSPSPMSSASTNNLLLSGSTNHAAAGIADLHHLPHQHHSGAARKSAYFVMDSVKVKRVGIISNDLLENKLVHYDSVTNTVSAAHQVAMPGASKAAAALMAASSFKHKAGASANGAPAAAAPTSYQFGDVYVSGDAAGAASEVGLEVDRFMETGVPLVGTDSVPDADALLVVSAGPDAQTASKVVLAAVEAASRYMAHRSLCVHVSAIALYGKVDDMLRGRRADGGNSDDEDCSTDDDESPSAAPGDETDKNKAAAAAAAAKKQQQQSQSSKPGAKKLSGGGATADHDESGRPTSLEDLIPANVTMTDLLEHGATKNHRPFAVSEPCDPFFDRYAPRHALRLGLSSGDIDHKLSTLRLQVEDQIVKNYGRAVAFLFFIDCIHFRDGFLRITKAAEHGGIGMGGGNAGGSQHAANSLFFSRTTVLATHVPQIATTLIGNTAALPDTALAQPWTRSLRHLGAEIHHVLSVVCTAPDDGAALSDDGAMTVSSVDEITFSPSLSAAADGNSGAGAAAAASSSLLVCSPETKAARDAAIIQLRRGFEVAAALSKTTPSSGNNNNKAGSTRDPLPDHVYPRRTHLKLAEYVALLKRVYDEQTSEQKTRHSFAKSALQFLGTASASSGDEAAKEIASHGGFSSDNRERFAAIFRAAFLKSKVTEKEKEEGAAAAAASANNNTNNPNASSGAGSASAQQQQQQQQYGVSGISADILALANQSINAGGGAGGGGGGGGGGKDAVKLRQQNEALLLIRERLEFDLAKLDKELKKLRGELTVSQARRRKLERELSDAQGRALTSETGAQRVRTEANTECLELRQKAINGQLQIDTLKRQNDELSALMDAMRVEGERALQACNERHEARHRDHATQMRIAQEEKAVLQAALEDLTRRLHAMEEQSVRADVERRDLLHQLADSAARIEAAQTDARRAVERAARARRAERDEYLRLLESGRCATEELVTFEDLRVDRVCASESVYRSGAGGVRAWLAAIGQAQYGSVFETAGFTDVLSVANVRDEDLREMRILAGHRRRILACAAELKAHLHLATAKRSTMMPSASFAAAAAAPSSPSHGDASGSAAAFERLVDGLRDWFKDFECSVRAEAAEQEEMLLALQQQQQQQQQLY